MHYEPTRVLNKVVTSSIAGALTTVLVYILTTFGGIDIPEYVVAALLTIVTALVAYATPLMEGEIRPVGHTQQVFELFQRLDAEERAKGKEESTTVL
jgi:hypothetical protein